ncbi:MAG: glycosyltransferase [Terriglobia bacterium]|jgi:glycosyltransferase involved in cell wall biosynthesis
MPMNAANSKGGKKLRVLTCAFVCSPSGNTQLGSGEAVLGWNLVTQLARFHEVHVLTHPSNREGIEKGLQVQTHPTLSFDYFDLPRWLGVLRKLQGCFQFYAYLWQIKAYFVARRLHRKIRFDAFHHLTYANDWAASFVGAFLPIPYLRGPCGGAQKTPRQFLSEYAWHNRLWERVRAGMGWVLRHDPIFLLGQSRARRILVCNRESLAAIPMRFRPKATLFPVNGISSEDLTLIASRNGSGVSRDHKATVSSAKPSKEFRILSAGRLIALKGYGLAIRAFKPFADQHADSKMVIVGEGPDLPRLEGIVRPLQLGGQVCFPGWMARDGLLAAMCSCDVFLFPSFRDGGGAVVVEAMAAGKPVVCMDLAGPGMHVTEECGIKIPARSPHEAIELMAQALERLYHDRELCVKMGQAGRARAEQVYSWDHLGERLLKIYEDALEAPSREA